MDETTVIAISLDQRVKDRLDAAAQAAGRNPSAVAEEAIAAYLDIDAWQTEAIRKGLEDAEAGDFMTETELAEAYKRWTS